MMRVNHFALMIFLLTVFLAYGSDAATQELKPRMLVLTDVSTWETDDSESLVRLFVHADLVEIEGLVFTTGWSLDTIRDDFVSLIHGAVDAYENDVPNLRKRSNQQNHSQEEAQQPIGYWPSPGYLRNRVVVGSRHRGAEHVGAGNDSAGSKLIIDLADETDSRPLWIAVWGGGNTLAQAIWRVQQDRTAEELKAFLSRLRVYTITDQDRDQKTPFSDSSHQWLRQEFEGKLFFIWDECAWKYQNGTGRNNWPEYETHIQNHGHLGKVYPKYKYGVEGDTPSFLHLLPLGLNDPQQPQQGGWGGYFAWGLSEDSKTRCYTNFQNPAYDASRQLLEHFYPATFHNFAARMDWAQDGRGNRNPAVVVEGNATLGIVQKTVEAESRVTLDGTASSDPDGDELAFRWWVLEPASTYTGPVQLSGEQTSQVTLNIPTDLADKAIHMICEVTDNGRPPLVGYRRIVLKLAK